jgi:hypothetical protein
METFEVKGYSVDYYVNNKYIGSNSITEPDREKFGYYGRKIETINTDLVIGKKKIKKGTTVMTELQKISGRLIKN